MEKSCKSCLDLISQKKTYSTDINTLKRKPPNEKHQMLPHYVGKYEPKQNNIDFETAKDILMEEDNKMIVKRRFERIRYMMDYYFTPKMKIFLKTKKYLSIVSSTLKQIKSIIIS